MIISKRSPASGPSIWRGADLVTQDRWVYQFTFDDIKELDAALEKLPPNISDLRKITTVAYPLPTLSEKFTKLQRDIIDGLGLVLIKGIPIDHYSPLEAAALYWMIGQHFGDPVSQNSAGHLLGHVKDVENSNGIPNQRAYQTNEALRYHTDSCDIVGLFCLQTTPTGGLSSIASAAAVHNAILDNRPDLLEILYKPFAISRIGEIPKGQMPWYMTPIFNEFGGCLTCIYPARDLRAAANLPSAPRLTDLQKEALDLLDSYAETFSLKMDFEPGDIQFLHNHTGLHGRTAYNDDPSQGIRRHLLRLWLSAPNGRPLPPHFADRYGTVEQGAVRGGIICPETKLSTPLDIV